MNDILFYAKEEIKRADHLLFVSLKYTRTVDVIKGIIERLLNVYEIIIEGILVKAEEDAILFEVPKVVKQRVAEVIKLYPDDKMNEYMNFFSYLKKIDKCDYVCAGEYRKHVHMTVTFPDGDSAKVTMDDLKEYFLKTKEFVHYVEELHLLEQK